DLGASDVIGRLEAPSRPLAKTRWAGAIDSVGGDTLTAILPEVHYGGSVACFGLAGGSDLNTTVFPFILRGVNLLGIDSVMCPSDYRVQVWEKAFNTLTPTKLESMRQIEPLSNVPQLAKDILAGQVRGRIIVDVTNY
ncbi:MAG: oxidoreductase, partial [Chloroflexota bacterium]